MAANTRLDKLSDLVRHKANLRVTCRTCSHARVLDASRFSRFCLLRRWNSHLQALATRLVCARCGARNAHLKATPDRADPDGLPRSEAEWKRLLKRLRD